MITCILKFDSKFICFFKRKEIVNDALIDVVIIK